MLIIGITGTIGAGKGTVVEYLTENAGFAHFSVRNYLTEILKSEGKEANRDNFTALANKLRTDNQSPSYIIEELYDKAIKSSQKAIIESIRTVGEIDKLKELGSFYLLAVDADKKKRFDRISIRNNETDKIGYEKFLLDEEREMNSTNPNNQNLSACIRLADYKIINDGDLNILHYEIEQFLSKINISNA